MGQGEFRFSRGLLGLLVSFCLAVALFVASIGFEQTPDDRHNGIAIEHSSDILHGELPCDDRVICSAYILPHRFGVDTLDVGYQEYLISGKTPILRFTTPQVDLPPPRYTA